MGAGGRLFSSVVRESLVPPTVLLTIPKKYSKELFNLIVSYSNQAPAFYRDIRVRGAAGGRGASGPLINTLV